MKTAIFQVGIITAPHGVHGEVRVFPTTDDPLHYKKLKTVLMEPVKKRPAGRPGGTSGKKDISPVSGGASQERPAETAKITGKALREKSAGISRQAGAWTAPAGKPGEAAPKTVQVEGKEYLVYHIRQVKFSRNMAIIQFAEITSMDEAEGYRNRAVYILREQSVPCGENENFIADLIDMEVQDEEGRVLGTLTDVLETGANDVYVVTRADGREILIPAIRECILDVSVEENRMTVHLLPGLI